MGGNSSEENDSSRPTTLHRQYRALLQAAPDPIFVADAETGKIIEVNEAAEAFRAQPREEIIGLHQSALHPPNETERYEELFAVHLEEEGKRRFNPDGTQIFAVDGNGDKIPVEITAKTVELPDGPIIYGTFQDISDRIARNKELRRFEQAVNSAGHSIYFTDLFGEILYVNPAFEDLTGFSAEEAIGETPHILNSGEMPAGYFDNQWETVLSGETWQEEIINRRKDGEVYTALQTISPISAADELEGYVAIQTDITEKKAQEEQLREQKERLDEFASVVSHDLRNPLNVVDGRIELANEDCDSEHLVAAAEGVERCYSLIDDLLALARGGQEVRDVEPVEMSTLIDVSWDTVETAEASVVADLDSKILADKARLRQLLENMFRNAVEHGGTAVTVRVGAQENGFFIADDGSGIPEAKRSEVFDQGYSESNESTGFGLSIVQQIVEAHGWDVRIVDSWDDGARFEITGVETVAE